jgi:hypothetical protein
MMSWGLARIGTTPQTASFKGRFFRRRLPCVESWSFLGLRIMLQCMHCAQLGVGSFHPILYSWAVSPFSCCAACLAIRERSMLDFPFRSFLPVLRCRGVSVLGRDASSKASTSRISDFLFPFHHRLFNIQFSVSEASKREF